MYLGLHYKCKKSTTLVSKEDSLIAVHPDELHPELIVNEYSCKLEPKVLALPRNADLDNDMPP